MTKITVTKLEAARCQVDAAIIMLFDGGNFVPIHTLAAAAGRILRDICEHKETPFAQRVTDLIVPGKEREFWTAMNRAANFFKHAEGDPEAVLQDVNEEANDMLLFHCVTYWRDLGQEMTSEMNALFSFVIATRPAILKPEGWTLLKDDMAWFRELPRATQLKYMKEVLARPRW